MNNTKKFKSSEKDIKALGIFFSVKSVEDFRRLFTNHLSMHFLPIIVDERQVGFDSAIPQLCIRDYTLKDEIQNVHTSFSNSRFVDDKENKIISSIESLKRKYLEVRNESENYDNPEEGDPRLIEVKNAIQTARLSINTTTNADIPEEWKKSIYGFANKTGIEISEEFWNVGNLKKSVLNFSPMLGGGTSYSGSEEEKERYESIRDLYCNVRELNEYRKYFGILDSFHLLKLTIANTGTSFDEDIDVKLTIEKGIYVKGTSLPIPGRDIINELLKIKFIENSYKMKMTDKVISYSGYPVLMQKVNYRINDPFTFKSNDEEYNESIENYSGYIKEVFFYDVFEKSEEDVLTFHIDYLKHNTIMAFPSYLIFRTVPGKIRYEISSKHIPNIITGELNVKE